MELIQFEPNVPQQLKLRNTSPLKLSAGAGCLYTLTDGRLLHLGSREADSLGALKLEAGESFHVCLHQKTGGLAYWDMWLSPETEKARAEREAPELERQLAASLELVGRRRYPDQAVLAPTGTEGGALPAVARKPAIAAVAGGRKREKSGPIPLNVAFREITRFVVAELNASGEQWSENSRQDLISTILISAQKSNLLGVWERQGEAA